MITGVHPNNTVYYKIVVKSEGAEDRLESLPLEYTLVADTDRPPLPTGIAVIRRELNERDDVIDLREHKDRQVNGYHVIMGKADKLG